MENNKKLMLIVFFLSILGSSCAKRVTTIGSENSGIQLQIKSLEGKIQYEVSFKGKVLINPSGLGLLSSEFNFVPAEIIRITQAKIQEQWHPLFGKSGLVDNTYHEATVEAKTKDGLLIHVNFRVFNDGVAFRYEVPVQNGLDSLTITEDKTTFCFSQDFNCRGIDQNIETSDFSPKPISQTKFSQLPLLVHTPECWLAINEASVFDFSVLYLRNNSTSATMSADIGISPCSLPLRTPWRVIQIGENAGDLIESNILVNLNEPCQIEDPSWIKPGKAMWDWRNHGDTINGFVYGINEASYKRLIDFASGNLIEYVLFDADWYSEFGPQYPSKDLDMPEIIKYANKKNVGVLLYIDRHRAGNNNDWNLEDVLNTFQKWGASGIKYGFLSQETNDRKTFVDLTREITRLCAKHRMLVDFHDNPVHPGGEERTWPNRITLEYCHGQQDSRKSFGPEIAVTAPFINGLSGPLDMANGYYDLNGLQNRSKVDKNGLNSTVVGETARCLINYSPLMILPDNGDVYNQKKDLFSFIRDMPDTWDETRFLGGEPGEFIIVARRSGRNWFVAGNTNVKARRVDLKLDFLEGREYNLIRYQDTKDSHFQKNKESYEVHIGTVAKDQVLTLPMAPGGGFCIKIIAE
ncbi:MAG: glycoside hydrolase family 97 protein [Prolixibacteraceae bacterium]|nr:glycoside hydrolase family 97 protein [Prolixibacteraceae bacterium]